MQLRTRWRVASGVRKLTIALAAIVVAAGLALLGRAIATPGESTSATTSEAITAPSPTAQALPAGAVSAYPAPGVLTASSSTQISFRGVAPDKLGEIAVTGSRSGHHAGRVLAHSDGKGASFVPSKRFRAGERVTVRTKLAVAGAKDGKFSITIARQAGRRAIRAQEPPNHGHGATVHVASRPDLIPPAVSVTSAKAGQAAGDVFLAPKGGRGQDGPMIVDDKGRLVWFKPMPHNRIAADFRVQTYRRNPVLTWWQGGLIVGDGRGYGVIYDQRYRRIKTVRAGNGYSMDLHEFALTPQGTALVIAYNRVKQDLSALGGPRDAVAVDGVVQEIDVKTGLVLFEWHSIGSVGLDEGKTALPEKADGEYDYMHTNSVGLDADGNFIVSARNTWGVYKIDRRTAKLVWRLGGTKPTLKMGKGTTTAWQHHARVLPDGTIMIFDNGASPPVHKASRVITVRVDERAKTATLVAQSAHPRGILSATQGSAEPLPNGDTFVGYGSQRYFSEFDAKGRLVLDGRLARGNDSYRAYRMPWEGHPAAPPNLVATTSGGRVTAHASWNGATEVARWQLLAGPSRQALEPVADRRASGFETAVTAKTSQRLLAVRALDAGGHELGTSAPITPRRGRS